MVIDRDVKWIEPKIMLMIKIGSTMRIIFAKTVKKYSLPGKKICLKQMIYLDVLEIVLRTVNSL